MKATRTTVREVRCYTGDEPIVQAIMEAAKRCSFKVVSQQDSLVQMKVAMSWLSFGERMEVSLITVGEQVLIDVSSRCSISATIEDWGKNDNNVQEFWSALGEIVGQGSCGSPVPLCASCGYPQIGIEGDRCPECGGAEFQARLTGESCEKGPWKSALKYVLLFTCLELVLFRFLPQEVFPFRGLSRLLGVHEYIMLLFSNFVFLFGVVLIGEVRRRGRKQILDRSDSQQ